MLCSARLDSLGAYSRSLSRERLGARRTACSTTTWSSRITSRAPRAVASSESRESRAPAARRAGPLRGAHPTQRMRRVGATCACNDVARAPWHGLARHHVQSQTKARLCRVAAGHGSACSGRQGPHAPLATRRHPIRIREAGCAWAPRLLWPTRRATSRLAYKKYCCPKSLNYSHKRIASAQGLEDTPRTRNKK